MVPLPQLIEPLFVDAGWKPGSEEVDESKLVSAQRIVTEILKHFGGLRVGQSGPGTEQAASDVSFYSSYRPEVSAVVSPWKPQVGECAAFGTAHNDHMILFVNDAGTYFVFTDPDERLYQLRGSFGEAMQTLLWGYSYGTPLSRAA